MVLVRSIIFLCSDATDGSNGGVFSPATFGLGNGFDLSGEQFDTRPEDIRCERRDLKLELILKSWQIQQRRRGENKWSGEVTQWGYGRGAEEAKH